MDVAGQHKIIEFIAIFYELVPMDLVGQHQITAIHCFFLCFGSGGPCRTPSNHVNSLLFSMIWFGRTLPDTIKSCKFIAIFYELVPVHLAGHHQIMQIHCYFL